MFVARFARKLGHETSDFGHLFITALLQFSNFSWISTKNKMCIIWFNTYKSSSKNFLDNLDFKSAVNTNNLVASRHFWHNLMSNYCVVPTDFPFFSRLCLILILRVIWLGHDCNVIMIGWWLIRRLFWSYCSSSATYVIHGGIYKWDDIKAKWHRW